MKALIVGGTKGFGKEVFRELLTKNYSVVTVARSDADYICDVGDLEVWKETLDQIKKQHRSFDIVFFIVGYARAKSSKDLTKEDWSEHLNKNLVYVALGLEQLKENISNGTIIITIGSQWSYRVGNDELVPYTVSKHALNTLTQDFALRNQSVIANHYCMPTMDTPQYREVEKSYSSIDKTFPFIEPAEASQIAKSLVSHVLNYKKTAKTLVIDKKGQIEEI